MAADETGGPGGADGFDGPDGAAQHRELLRQARANCRRVLDELNRDAAHLAAHRPSALVPGDVLDEGREVYARAAAGAEALLRRLDEALADSP